MPGGAKAMPIPGMFEATQVEPLVLEVTVTLLGATILGAVASEIEMVSSTGALSELGSCCALRIAT